MSDFGDFSKGNGGEEAAEDVASDKGAMQKGNQGEADDAVKQTTAAVLKGDGEGDNEVEEEDDKVVNLGELLAEDEQREQEADSLLGGQDSTVCSYPEGYKPRQPLYSCQTCYKAMGETGQPAAVCLGCTYACHDGHDLVELYTKRRVCCDCGNSRFPNKCKLYENKKTTNERNRYNQNYDGKYCVCSRPYPDPDNDVADEMIQCNVCEDWFHSRHLSADGSTALPKEKGDALVEMTCKDCVKKLPFLLAYYRAESSSGETKNEEEEEEKGDSAEKGDCRLAALGGSPSVDDVTADALYWQCNTWRERLCKCPKCDGMYDDLDCAYLTDMEDSVGVYEAKAREAAETERGGTSFFQSVVTALNSVDRTAANVFAQGVGNLKRKLDEICLRVGNEGGVVTEADVKAIFAGLREEHAAKLRRLDGGCGMPPPNCHNGSDSGSFD